MPGTQYPGWLKACNVVSYLCFASSNVYSFLGGDSVRFGKPVETYLTPAQWLFGIWPVINTLFFGLLFYQFTPHGGKVVTERLGWRFPALFVLNAIYNALYSFRGHWVLNLLSFGVLCLVAGIVSHLYGSLRTGPESETLTERLLVHLPISLYHGFVVVIFFVSMFAVGGVDVDHHKAGVFTKVLVFVTLFFLQSTATGYVFYGNGDIAGATVISLGLLAIAQEQRKSRFIHWSAMYVYVANVQGLFRYLVHCRAACRVCLGAVAAQRAAPRHGYGRRTGAARALVTSSVRSTTCTASWFV